MKELLSKVELLAGLDPRLLGEVAESGVVRRYRPGEVIVEQGQTGLGMYLVIRGQVSVRVAHQNLNRQLALLGPEQFFAEMALLDDRPRSASVVATAETECLLLTRDRFTMLMRKFPELPIRVARVLAARLRTANDRLLTEAATQPAMPSPPAREVTPRPPAAPVKRQIESAFLSLFQSLYVMKAMTNFSVAVLGCPVEGVGPHGVEVLRVGDVKAVVAPSAGRTNIDIVASAPGEFTLHVITPAEPRFWRSGPHRIDTGSSWRLVFEGFQARLREPARISPAGIAGLGAS